MGTVKTSQQLWKKEITEPDVRVLVLSWVEQMNAPLCNFHCRRQLDRFPFPAALCRNPYLSIWGGVDPVVVNTSLVPERDGQLPWAALTLTNQEAAIDEAAQQILCCAAWHRPVIPRVLLQAVDWCDVVAWYPALPILRTYLTPFTILVVTQDSQLLTYDPGGKKAE